MKTCPSVETGKEKTQFGSLVENQHPLFLALLPYNLLDYIADPVKHAEPAAENFVALAEACFVDMPYIANADVHIDVPVVVPFVSFDVALFAALAAESSDEWPVGASAALTAGVAAVAYADLAADAFVAPFETSFADLEAALSVAGFVVEQTAQDFVWAVPFVNLVGLTPVGQKPAPPLIPAAVLLLVLAVEVTGLFVAPVVVHPEQLAFVPSVPPHH